MYVILVVGGARQGKTPFIKEYSRGSNLLAFDVQNEYGSRAKYPGQPVLNLPTNNKLARSRVVKVNVKEFMTICKTKKNTICVFEEATIFFQGIIGEQARELIFSKAHTGNIYILVFHSINSIPPRIMEGTDFVVLFRTGDVEDTVKNKFPILLPYYKILRRSKDGTNFKIRVA